MAIVEKTVGSSPLRHNQPAQHKKPADAGFFALNARPLGARKWELLSDIDHKG
ncbi:hypothetical protein ALQ79_200144 [Pseudomonas amygdali pv. lachrymans]|nr:hypothetical protein ALQ79_200144 [Pseudomonas amygdali pv. lachrymans]